MVDASRRDRRHALWLFAICFLFYMSTASGVLDFGDDWSMLQVTRSIVERGDIDVPASSPDPVQGPDGRYYSKYGIGQSILATPFYVVGVWVGDLTGNPARRAGILAQATPLTYAVTMLGMVATAASVALFFASAREIGFGTRASSVAALALGLGTFAWYWARTFMSEPTTMLMMLTAFYAQLRDSKRPGARWLLLAGAALGFAVLLRFAAVAVLPGFGLWLLWETWRRWSTFQWAIARVAAWTLPVFAGLGGVLVYNFVRTASFTNTGYGSAADHLGGTLAVGLYGLFLSPGRSLFLYAPILIVSVLGSFFLWRTHRTIAVVLGLIVVPHVLFHARLPYWDGGGCWSPRYLANMLPFLMFGLAALADSGLTRVGWIAVGVLSIASAFVQSLGLAIPCIPYAGRMLSSPVTARQLLWDATSSPLAEHTRSMFAQDQSFYLAPVLFGSTVLWWIQGTALVTGCLLLVIYLRSVFRS